MNDLDARITERYAELREATARRSNLEEEWEEANIDVFRLEGAVIELMKMKEESEPSPDSS